MTPAISIPKVGMNQKGGITLTVLGLRAGRAGRHQNNNEKTQWPGSQIRECMKTVSPHTTV